MQPTVDRIAAILLQSQQEGRAMHDPYETRWEGALLTLSGEVRFWHFLAKNTTTEVHSDLRSIHAKKAHKRKTGQSDY